MAMENPLQASGVLHMDSPADKSAYRFNPGEVEHFSLPFPRKKKKLVFDAQHVHLEQSIHSPARFMEGFRSQVRGATDDGSPTRAGDEEVEAQEEAEVVGGDVTRSEPDSFSRMDIGADVYNDIIQNALKLVTGEDVVNFFAQHGSTSPIKFVHLTRADTGIKFRPYDLVVTNPRDCGPDYYTMSPSGLVHIQAGEPSEFVPLADWMRQSTLFNMLRSMRFFRVYLHTKCFNLWKSNVRYKLYCRQRRIVADRLFIGKDSFCGGILKLKDHMFEVENVGLINFGSRTMMRDEFNDAQADKRQQAAKLLDACMENVQEAVRTVCTDVTKSVVDAEKDETDGDGVFGYDNKKYKSMVQIKKQEQERRKRYRQAKQEKSMLPAFIRLADYIMVESMVSLALSAEQNFLEVSSKEDYAWSRLRFGIISWRQRL
eukprot:scaffold926_cov248-Pinguiococcus_pyrenoidosus.AAC.16